MFEKIDEAVKEKISFLDGSHVQREIIFSQVVHEAVKTVIVKVRYLELVEWWLYESSHLTEDETETNVDVIRLDNAALSALGLRDREEKNAREYAEKEIERIESLESGFPHFTEVELSIIKNLIVESYRAGQVAVLKKSLLG